MLSALLSCALAAAAFTPQVTTRIDASASSAANGPRLLIGELSEPLEGDLTVAARDWALEHRELLGLPKLATLELDAAFHTRFGASMHYLQKMHGLRVHAAKLVITLDQKARVAMVSSSLENLEAANTVARTSEREALLIAAGAVPFPAMRGPMPYGGGRQELFRVGDELHTGWFVHVPTISQADNYYAAIDATDGALLWARNRVYRAADDAHAYNPSPGGPDGGVGRTPTIAVTLTHSDGGSMVIPTDGGYLTGTQLTAYNCCVNQGCATVLPDGGTLVDPDGGLWPKMVSGTTSFNGLNIQYETVECDRMQRASNDPSIHDAGSYVYPPYDPPLLVSGQPGPVVQTDPAHTDEFAEVHAFYQVNRVYDWLRELSTYSAVTFPNQSPAIGPFKMRDERRTPAQKPAVWANVMFPDFQQVNIQCLAFPPCKLAALGRIDNAAFLARENFAQIPLPDYRLDVDTLMIFQGNRADFGYDGTVLWHEFGHGAVYATAALEFGVLALDSRSANDEGGALHEGLADYMAAAFGNDAVMGPYVGSRIGGGAQVPGAPVDNYLRNLDNNFSCPSVLWGEVHQDSQHVSAALWKARKDFFQGTDNGRTFDAAFYGALVAMAPTADFAQTAALITAHVKDAFTATISDAETRMQSIFASKGVTGCVKTIDMTNLGSTRPMYGIGQRAGAGVNQGVLPGPYQMKFKTPNGARSVTISGQAGGGIPGFGGAPDVRLLAKANSPITFTRSGTTLNNDADRSATAAASGSTLTATVDIDVPCGATSEVHFTIGTNANSAVNLSNVQVTFEQAATCNPVADGGTDGGSTDGGGGNNTVFVPAVPDKTAGGPAVAGCTCGTGAGVPGFLGLLLLALRARRRAQR